MLRSRRFAGFREIVRASRLHHDSCFVRQRLHLRRPRCSTKVKTALPTSAGYWSNSNSLSLIGRAREDEAAEPV